MLYSYTVLPQLCYTVTLCFPNYAIQLHCASPTMLYSYTVLPQLCCTVTRCFPTMLYSYTVLPQLCYTVTLCFPNYLINSLPHYANVSYILSLLCSLFGIVCRSNKFFADQLMLVPMRQKMTRLGKGYIVFHVFLSFILINLFVILGVDSYLAISSYPPRQLVKYPPLLQVGLTLSSYVQFLHSSSYMQVPYLCKSVRKLSLLFLKVKNYHKFMYEKK